MQDGRGQLPVTYRVYVFWDEHRHCTHSLYVMWLPHHNIHSPATKADKENIRVCPLLLGCVAMLFTSPFLHLLCTRTQEHGCISFREYGENYLQWLPHMAPHVVEVPSSKVKGGNKIVWQREMPAAMCFILVLQYLDANWRGAENLNI